jgi:hypothetical protein
MITPRLACPPTLLLILAGLLAPPALPGQSDSRPQPPLSVAILNFQTSGDTLQGKGAEAAGLLNAQLSSAAPELVLVEREEIDKVLGEQELGLSGTVTPDSAARLGALTGAKVFITGRLFEADERMYLVAKIIGTETGRVYGESVSFERTVALDKATAELSAKLATDLKTRGDTLVAKVASPAAQLERLKKIVAGHQLPTIGVAIQEQHIGRAVIDPAAQTEMMLLLAQLGFEVLDPQSGRQPDVQITGEAFSELAGRRGNLISCRARVEIKVIQLGSGKLLLTDRQTDVAVDLAEQVAGKAALENAAAILLDRIVPKLVAP